MGNESKLMMIKNCGEEIKVEYDDSTHSYFVNSKRCISVTQLLKETKFGSKYENIPEYILKNASNLGSDVHEQIEIYCKYGIPSDESEEFRNFLFLKKMFKFNVLDNEILVVIKYKELYICGRLDLLLEDENGNLMLGDIKRTCTLDKEYLFYQLNLYKIGFEQCYGKEIKALKGIHLRKEKRKYVDIPINEKEIFKILDEYLMREYR